TDVYLAPMEERTDSVCAVAPSGCVPLSCGGGRRIRIWVLAHGPPCDGAAGPVQRRFRLARPSPGGGLVKRLTRSNRRVRTRMPGGVGGEEPRGSPLSRSERKDAPTRGPSEGAGRSRRGCLWRSLMG